MGWRGYSVLINYQSLVSILFPLAPLQLFFSINIQMKQITPRQCRRYGGGKGAVPPPPERLLVPPHFGVLKLLFLEHHETAARQQQ